MKKILISVVIVLIGLLTIGASAYGYFYFTTPEHIRHPEVEHYHFRTQIIVDSTPVDFSKDKFQTETGTTCSADPGSTPIDFHDQMDQMTHVHWNGMTGGEFLKYYGWDLTDRNSDNLGQRYDDNYMPMGPVMRYGDVLPAIPDGANFYVYTGDASGYKKRSWNDFLHQNIENFFGKKSNLKQAVNTTSGPLDWLFPTAYAHGGVTDGHEGTESSGKTEEELTRINNLIGNVVIFVQKTEPTANEIKARFDNLVPLSDSVCGG